MPRVVCNQPKTLFDICVAYAADNIDYILKYEEQAELSSNHDNNRITFHELPTSLHQLLTDKFLEIGTINDGNYHKILNHRTLNLVIGPDKCKIFNHFKFLEYIRDNCKNVVKLDLTPLLQSHSWFASDSSNSSKGCTLICETLSAMPHLEWLTFGVDCDYEDECLEVIGSKCTKLKFLNVRSLPNDPDTPKGIISVARNCRQLTHLILHYEPDMNQFNPDSIAEFVLLCPDLEVLDYQFSATSVTAAIDRLSKLSVETNSNALTLISEPCIFKLKQLSVDCEGSDGFDVTRNNFDQLGKHCPLVESLNVYDYPSYLNDNSIIELSHLPLRSFTVAGSEWEAEPIPRDIVTFLRSVGNNLAHLKLANQSWIDLRAISQDCPNLTDLTLERCEEIGPTLTSYTPGLFKSLTSLTIECTEVISDEIYFALLSSPNLEKLDLDLAHDMEDEDEEREPIPILDLLSRCPDAFSKLLTIRLLSVEMSIPVLSAILDRAVLLQYLTAKFCYAVVPRGRIGFYKKKYVDELISINNWALKCEW